MHIIITRLSRTQDISSGHFVNKKSKFSFKLRKNNKNKNKKNVCFFCPAYIAHSLLRSKFQLSALSTVLFFNIIWALRI